MTRSHRHQLTMEVSLTSYKITIYVVPPLALVTNSLSIVTFARMYRAKQQVISKNMHNLDGRHNQCKFKIICPFIVTLRHIFGLGLACGMLVAI